MIEHIEHADCEHSEDISKLAGALAAAQGMMSNPSKDSVNPFFKSRYADLAAVIDSCRTALAANGLAVMQMPSVSYEVREFHLKMPKTVEESELKIGVARIRLTTILAHSSGQWVRNSLLVYANDATVQSVGAAITYARRYAWQSLVGLAAEDDDDGNQASNGRPAPARQPVKPVDYYAAAVDAFAKASDIMHWRSLRERVWTATDTFTPEQQAALDLLAAKRSCDLMRAAKDTTALEAIGDACAAASAERAFSESAIAEMNATYQEQLAKLETPAEPAKPTGPALALHSQVSAIDAWIEKLGWGPETKAEWLGKYLVNRVGQLSMEQATVVEAELKAFVETAKPAPAKIELSPRQRAEKALREADTIEMLNTVREQVYASAKNLKKHFDDLDSIYGERATEFLGSGGTSAWEKILASHHKHSLPAKISDGLEATYTALQAAQEVPT